MALKDLMRRWLRLQMVDGSKALRLHDAIDERFTDLHGDLERVDEQTLLPLADSEGLERWGIDIGIQRQSYDTDLSYRTTLLFFWRGNAVNKDAIIALLDTAGILYRLHESLNDQFFLDSSYLDNDRFLEDGKVIFIEIISLGSYDPDGLVLNQSYLDQGYLTNWTPTLRQIGILNTLQRIKAYGVKVILEIPSYISF